jgi:hypothetical protein
MPKEQAQRVCIRLGTAGVPAPCLDDMATASRVVR